MPQFAPYTNYDFTGRDQAQLLRNFQELESLPATYTTGTTVASTFAGPTDAMDLRVPVAGYSQVVIEASVNFYSAALGSSVFLRLHVTNPNGSTFTDPFAPHTGHDVFPQGRGSLSAVWRPTVNGATLFTVQLDSQQTTAVTVFNKRMTVLNF